MQKKENQTPTRRCILLRKFLRFLILLNAPTPLHHFFNPTNARPLYISLPSLLLVGVIMHALLTRGLYGFQYLCSTFLCYMWHVPLIITLQVTKFVPLTVMLFWYTYFVLMISKKSTRPSGSWTDSMCVCACWGLQHLWMCIMLSCSMQDMR